MRPKVAETAGATVMRLLPLALRCLTAAWVASASLAALAQAPAVPPPALRDCSDCPPMVEVPAGRFTMGGSPAEHQRAGVTPDYAATELPAHEVRIARPFLMSLYPVTRDEWAAFAATDASAAHAADEAAHGVAPGCAVLRPEGVWGVEPNRSWRDPGFVQTGRDPVVCVNWGEAKAYAAWLSARSGRRYRLPTEAEWEYAARAGTTTANYWGPDRENACAFGNASDLTLAERYAYARSLPDSSFLCHDGFVYTAPVDAFPPNGFGLYGMAANVWQWVEDCFTASYDGAPADGSARGDGDCHYHLDRGASWVNSPRFVRVAARHKDLVDARNSVLGFRLVREIAP